MHAHRILGKAAARTLSASYVDDFGKRFTAARIGCRNRLSSAAATAFRLPFLLRLFFFDDVSLLQLLSPFDVSPLLGSFLRERERKSGKRGRERDKRDERVYCPAHEGARGRAWGRLTAAESDLAEGARAFLAWRGRGATVAHPANGTHRVIAAHCGVTK